MAGLVPGGLLLAIVHIAEQGEEPTKTRLMPGELAKYFSDWGIVYRYEGKPHDSNHQRSVAEIAARRPGRRRYAEIGRNEIESGQSESLPAQNVRRVEDD